MATVRVEPYIKNVSDREQQETYEYFLKRDLELALKDKAFRREEEDEEEEYSE